MGRLCRLERYRPPRETYACPLITWTDNSDLPGLQAASLSILGAPTQTAYHGIMDVLNVQPEHTVTITNAAG